VKGFLCWIIKDHVKSGMWVFKIMWKCIVMSFSNLAWDN